MPTPARRRLRHARRGAWYFVAIALVVVALVLGIASRLLPLAEQHPDRVAAWLSERAGRPVAFDTIDTRWTRRGPLLRLDGLRVGAADGDGMIAIGDAEMLVSLYAGLLPDTPFTELRLHGLELILERGGDGRWHVQGLPGQQQSAGDPLAVLEGLGELQVVDGRLRVLAPGLGIDALLPRVDLRLRVEGDRVRAGLRAWMGGDRSDERSAIDARLDYDRRDGSGRAWLGSEQVDLGAWSSLLQLGGAGVETGHGHGQVWARLHDHRIVALTVDTLLDDVRLRGAPLRAERGLVSRPQVVFERLRARARWRMVDGGWRLDAPLLRITSNGREQTLDGLLLAGGERFALLADRVDVGPLLALATLSNRVDLSWRRWLAAAKPVASLRDIVVFGRQGGPLRASGRIVGLGFAAVGDRPGLSGLSASLQGDAKGVSLVLDPVPVEVDWPRGFGVAHVATLSGHVSGWRADDGAGWHVATPDLRIDSEHFVAQIRGGLQWQGDGTRPRIDLALAIDDAPVTLAKGFWIRHKMPATAVEWLDAALQGGRLRDARALVSGDLDNWPFSEGSDVPADGVFRARARISDGVVKFHPDWPAITHIQADVAFAGDGMDIDGSGAISDVAVEQFHADIDHFDGGRLQVDAHANSEVAHLLGLLRDSPLQSRYRDTLDNLVGKGPARVGFSLLLPLHHDDGAQRISGTVELDGVTLHDKRWNLAFDKVRGHVDYSQDGFKAENLKIRHDGAPGTLSLFAGASTGDPSLAFAADLQAGFTAAELLAHAPQLDWLQPYVTGRSAWSAHLAIPKSKGREPSAPIRLQLQSDLAGTALKLPVPLHKPAGLPLPATIELDLPLERGEIRVALGQKLGVRARTRNDKTGIRVALGSSEVAMPPSSGLAVGGHAPRLDAIDWIALATTGNGNDGGMQLQAIDVVTGRLLLLGGEFANTRIRVQPGKDGMTVQAQGDTLRGELQIPGDRKRVVQGRFERVHWRSADSDATSDTATAKADARSPLAEHAIDPSAIPPLAIEIDELQIGDAALGRATLRTQPVAAGLSIEQLQTIAPTQRIDISGDWLGQRAAMRTRMTATIDSDDFGALLAGFGFGGRLAGGDGVVHFEGRWPGNPADFGLSSIDATLVLGARDGRLLQVEPGVGRMLGLLSIAELPRRLSLDFRDMFSKGFAFNSIDGTVRAANGMARTDDLVIDGPSATINIHGSANLDAKTFDQTIVVLPKTGNVLTAVGAIAAGPVGAAIGAVANAVLSKPLGQAAAKTYRVTGPWKEPVVTTVERNGESQPQSLPPPQPSEQTPAMPSGTEPSQSKPEPMPAPTRVPVQTPSSGLGPAA